MRRVVPAVLSTFLAAGVLIAGPVANAAPQAEPAAPASTFTSLSPVRVLDTRTGTGAVGPGGTITLNLAAHVPATATAVVLNVTGVQPTANTHLIVFPAGITRPTTSSLNLPAGDIRANQVTVTLGTNRSVSLFNNAGNTHLVADLAGYYGTGAGAKFTTLPQKRMLDTRLDGGPVGAGGTRVLDLSDAIPASATAVTFNLTATNPTMSTFVTAYPTGSAVPTASSLNIPAGDTRANLVTVTVGANRTVSLYNLAGTVDLVVDVTGFHTPDYGAVFVPFNPKRVLDTRFGTGGPAEPVYHTQARGLDLAGEVPANATGVVMNVTGVDATVPTHVTTMADVGDVPTASTLNLSPGQAVANAAVTVFVNSRTMYFYNNAGAVHLVADLAGVFVTPEADCVTDCLYAWGDNTERKLGTGDSAPTSATPRRAVALSGVVAVDGGTQNGYALRADGTVRAWGDNYFGNLGNGWTTGQYYGLSATPVPVVGLTDVTAVAAHNDGAYALRADGTVWAWGANHSGQLGNGTRTNSSVPVRVSGLTDVVAIAGGQITGYAVRADGTVWAWGYHGGVLFGDDVNIVDSTTPVRVTSLDGVVAVATGNTAVYALRADGTVRAWGYNGNGELGNGQPCDPGGPCVSVLPVAVTGLTGVTAIAAGGANGVALRGDGTVWTWGGNGRGQLGNGVECQDTDMCRSTVPVQVSNLSNATQVASFEQGAYARRVDGTVVAWGSDFYEGLGNDSVADHTTVPVPVVGLPSASAIGGAEGSGYAIGPGAS